MPEGVELTSRLRADTDVAHVFTTRRARLAEALRGTLVDIKVCAVDGTWSGLKLVLRKEKRKAR